jgi:hypothetical protein
MDNHNILAGHHHRGERYFAMLVSHRRCIWILSSSNDLEGIQLVHI